MVARMKKRAKPRTVGVPQPALPLVKFIKIGQGWIANNHYDHGAAVYMTERAAKYQLLRGALVVAPPAPAPDQTPAAQDAAIQQVADSLRAKAQALSAALPAATE